MIDLHSHILPALDDGAADMEVSLEMARAAVADGVSTMVATPHVDDRYGLDPPDIGEHVGHLNLALARAGIALGVLPGAEVAHTRAAALSPASLLTACLGDSKALLVESPYTSVSFFDDLLFDLQVRGFRPVLAHPERCLMFQRDPDRLAALVDRGIYCTVNAGSLSGGFGRKVRQAAVVMLARGLVHSIASDSHDTERRPPGLSTALDGLEGEIPGITAQAAWLTNDVPAALLADKPLPPRPPLPVKPASRWGRLRRGRGAPTRG
ncbi:MAG: protein-tyrosine phosphatase [Thermoleophilales bacterium]|nr:protein-tyrosine phosphatase [Thermoleophilales bacterium]